MACKLRFRCAILCCLLPGLTDTASGQKKTTCPDGDHYEINVKQIAIEYDASSFAGTLSSLSILGARLEVGPKKLQDAAAATQQWNEFLKGLAAGYNTCAITKQQYAEALSRIYPRLKDDVADLEKIRKLILEGQQADEKRLRTLLEDYYSNLRRFVQVSGRDVILARIEAVSEQVSTVLEGQQLILRTLDLKLGSNALSIASVKEPREAVSALDPHKYYVNSATGFRFKLPADEAFSKPAMLEGIEGLLAAKNAVLNPEIQQQLQTNLQVHPLGPAFQTVKIVRIAYGKSMTVECTDDTTNELIDRILARVKSIAKEQSVELTPEDLSKARRMAIGLDRLNFQDEFMVTVFDKRKLMEAPIKVTLPSLFVTLTSAMGLFTDKLVADEQSILGGVDLSLQNVKIDQKIGDFAVERWMLLTENKEAFFLVEIAYSPQTQEPLKVWEDLRDMMTSFRALE